MKILITDIFLRKTFDVVNILYRHYEKKDVLLLTEDLNVFNKLNCTLSYHSSNLFLLRKDENFNNDLNQILKKFPEEKVIYLPVEEDTTLLFYNFLSYENSPKNLFFLLPEKEVFERSTDKALLNLFCEENKIPCPKFVSAEGFENNTFQFPIIVKPKKGSGSKGVYYIDNQNELKGKKIDFKKNLVQERLPNSKNVEGGFFLCKDGEILSFYSHQRIRTFPESGGVTLFSKASEKQNIKEAGEQMTKALNWNGLLMIEFIFDERDNKYKVIEINPRMWGSILLSEYCSANFLVKYIELCVGRSKIENSAINNYNIRWIFPYDLFYFLKHPSNPFRFFSTNKDCCHINFTYSSFFRSLPFILLNYFYLAKLLRLFKQ